MAQQLLESRRQKLLKARNTRTFSPRKIGLIVVVIVLFVLLCGALLFLQASSASKQLKSATESSETELKKAVETVSKTVQERSILNPLDAEAIMKELTALSATADQLSETCTRHQKPLLPAMVQKYPSIMDQCQQIALSARSMRDGLNGLMPLAEYQIALAQSLNPADTYLKSESKTDIDAGITAWATSRDALQQMQAPEQLQANHAKIINASSQIVAEMTHLKAAKDANDAAAYSSKTAAIALQYKELNQSSALLKETMKTAQMKLTEVSRSL